MPLLWWVVWFGSLFGLWGWVLPGFYARVWFSEPGFSFVRPFLKMLRSSICLSSVVLGSMKWFHNLYGPFGGAVFMRSPRFVLRLVGSFVTREESRFFCGLFLWLVFGVAIAGNISCSSEEQLDSIRAAKVVEQEPCKTDDCQGPAVCRNGEERLLPMSCGLNGRGVLRQVCAVGAWVEAKDTPCIERDDCTDEEFQEVPCGINGNGIHIGMCILGRWSVTGTCQDDDVCLHGDMQTLACGANNTGTTMETCQNGQWQVTSPCSENASCTDGAQDNVSCGQNGQGFQTRRCQDGQWQLEGECIGAGECTSNLEDSVPCGPNGRGQQGRICTNGQWQLQGNCNGAGECVDNNVSNFVCGENGTQERLCISGMWQDQGSCEEAVVCINDSTRETEESCGPNGNSDTGRVIQTCINGQWVASGCEGALECRILPPETRNVPCNEFGAGEYQEICAFGVWVLLDRRSCMPYRTCAELLAAVPGLEDGLYRLNPDQEGRFQDVYCDMNNGGWTLVLNHPTRGEAQELVVEEDNNNSEEDLTLDKTARLPYSQIVSLLSTGSALRINIEEHTYYAALERFDASHSRIEFEASEVCPDTFENAASFLGADIGGELRLGILLNNESMDSNCRVGFNDSGMCNGFLRAGCSESTYACELPLDSTSQCLLAGSLWVK